MMNVVFHHNPVADLLKRSPTPCNCQYFGKKIGISGHMGQGVMPAPQSQNGCNREGGVEQDSNDEEMENRA